MRDIEGMGNIEDKCYERTNLKSNKQYGTIYNTNVKCATLEKYQQDENKKKWTQWKPSSLGQNENHKFEIGASQESVYTAKTSVGILELIACLLACHYEREQRSRNTIIDKA